MWIGIIAFVLAAAWLVIRHRRGTGSPMIRPAEERRTGGRTAHRPNLRRPLAERPGRGILPDVTAAVGHTPLVALDRFAADVRPRIVGKLEHMNPGGSVKDRIAPPMIEAAERAGLLKPGGVIVEPTSGNTGVGLAMAAAVKGYRCIFVMADKQSEEKRALLRAYGAEVVVCPTDVDPNDERSYYRVSDRLARETPGAWKPDQYHNDANPQAHHATTGPEIWRDTDGQSRTSWSHLAPAAPFGGGPLPEGAQSGRRDRGRRSGRIGLFGRQSRPYLTEGIGEDFWPTTYDPGSATSSCGQRPRLDAHRARRDRARGHPDGRVMRHGAVGRAPGRT